MSHGGQRDGAGRKPWKAHGDAMVTMSIKVSPSLRDRLREVASGLGKTHAEVVEMGVDAAEAKLAAAHRGAHGRGASSRKAKSKGVRS